MIRDQERRATLLEMVQSASLEFLDTLPHRPVAWTSKERPPALDLPEEGVGAEEAIRRFRQRFEAGMSGSAGPRYLGFVTGGSTPAALAGDWLAATYDQNLANEGDSIASDVERETIGMLRQLFHLPEEFEGAFVSGATMANTAALAVARQWVGERSGVDIADEGLAGLSPIPVLGGAPHTSVSKALAILGCGRKAVERVACLPNSQRVDPRAVEERLEALGRPAIVVASAGEVNTGEFDDLQALVDICRRHSAWLHVDGAFGLFAACDPSLKHNLDGLEGADSIATDGHKWLNVPYDSGIVLTRHMELQEKVFRASAVYLGDRPDLMHRTPENSRRFRALPAWATLVAYGREGYREMVARTCGLARRLGEHIDSSADFELLAPVHLNIVCFALREGDAERRDRFLAHLNGDGRVYMTPSVLAGRPAVRAAFSNWSTTEEDVEMVWSALCDAVAGCDRE